MFVTFSSFCCQATLRKNVILVPGSSRYNGPVPGEIDGLLETVRRIVFVLIR